MKTQKKRHKYLREEPKRSHKGLVVFLVILLILAAGGFAGWTFISGDIRDEVTMEVGGTVALNDFLEKENGLPTAMKTDLSALDLSVPGDHKVEIECCWLPFAATLQVRDTVAPVGTVQSLEVFSNRIPDAADFVTEVRDMTAVTASFASEPDTTMAGLQSVTIVLTDMGGNTAKYAATLTILFDEVAPEITGAADRTICMGQDADLLEGITVTDDMDTAPAITVDDSALNTGAAGTYPVTYTAVDGSGNETSVTVTITVIEDKEAPELLGVRPLTAYVGGTISYRSNVIVKDDVDAFPTLTIDSSAVDMSAPGTYTVIYTAADGAGNKTVMETTITVSEAPANFIETEVIYELADKVLAKITNDKMSDKAKVQAIYKWVLNECWYDNNNEKTDWLQAAHCMLAKGYGDCFGFYSVTRLLFERLGIPNLTIQRDPAASRTTTHYWSMVSVDGGETYYHFDSCPHPKPASNMCLVTDAKLEWFNGHCKDYYLYDKSLYPATPEE